MRKLFYIVILTTFALATNVKAQRYELGFQLGASNLVGDIGRTNYIYPLPSRDMSTYGIPVYAGLLFRMNFNPYQTLRFNIGYTNVYFSDKFAQENYRRQRVAPLDREVINSMIVGEVLFEYNFLPVNNEQKNGMLSPYIFAGLGGMLYDQPRLEVQNDFNRDVNDIAIQPDPTNPEDFNTTATYSYSKGMTVSIPFGVGLKYKFNYNWAIFGEFTFRPTFVDDIDYSWINDKNVKVTYNKDITDPTNNRKSLLQTSPYLEVADQRTQELLLRRNVGNPNSKDWINSMTIGLTYSFGRPPCYCD